jgi:hypothetical protein
MNAERADASAVVHMGYVSELFSSPRHAELPEDVRAEQLLRIALHYTASVSRDWTPGFRVPPPPFVRRGKQTRVPELNETRAADAWAATPVPSRRRAREEDTPAVRLMPATTVATKGHSASLAPVPHPRPACGSIVAWLPARVARIAAALAALAAAALAALTAAASPCAHTADEQARHVSSFYREAVAMLDAIVEQFDNVSDLADRLVGEQVLLTQAVAARHAVAVSQLDLSDQEAWAAMTQRALRSSFMHEQLKAAITAVEERAGAINNRMPGQPWGIEHELVPLGAMVFENWPEVATMLRMEWCRPQVDGCVFGRLHLAVYRASWHTVGRRASRSSRLLLPALPTPTLWLPQRASRLWVVYRWTSTRRPSRRRRGDIRLSLHTRFFCASRSQCCAGRRQTAASLPTRVRRLVRLGTRFVRLGTCECGSHVLVLGVTCPPKLGEVGEIVWREIIHGHTRNLRTCAL